MKRRPGKLRRNGRESRKTGKKENFLRKNYSLSWDYIKESKGYVFLVLLIFLTGALAGLIWQPAFFIERVRDFIERIMLETSSLGLGGLIVYILNNNLQASFFGMIFGVFAGVVSFFIALFNGYFLGFVARVAVKAGGLVILWRLVPHGIFEFPALILSLAFGMRLGFSLVHNTLRFYKKEKANLILVYLIIPFVVLSVFLIGSYLAFGSVIASIFLILLFLYILTVSMIFFVLTLLQEKLKNVFLYNTENSLRVFLFVILPLLIVAAVIEGILIIVVR